MNFLLIGARASGKTTLGKAVSAATHMPFVDLDAVVMGAFAEQTVQDIWAKHGEGAWRQAEAKALDEVLRQDDQIVALGGGTPMISEARAHLEDQRRAGRAWCIYLHCNASQLAERLSIDLGDRPSLTGADPSQEIATVLAQREPTYRAIADAVLDVTALSPPQAADALAGLIKNR